MEPHFHVTENGLPKSDTGTFEDRTSAEASATDRAATYVDDPDADYTVTGDVRDGLLHVTDGSRGRVRVIKIAPCAEPGCLYESTGAVTPPSGPDRLHDVTSARVDASQIEHAMATDSPISHDLGGANVQPLCRCGDGSGLTCTYHPERSHDLGGAWHE